jgi:ATP-dependent 26S proteasome regulatory subunit
MIHFPIPSIPQRTKLWQNAFSDKCTLDPDVDLNEIAKKYELAGGVIINVIRFASLMAVKRGDKRITKKDLINSIRREFGKEGKIVQ